MSECERCGKKNIDKIRHSLNCRPKKTLLERFNSYISKPNKEGCIEWLGNTKRSGYGCLVISDKNGVFPYRSLQKSNRIAYTLFVGEIPEGMFVCHHCDNRKCVNPEHLFLGTNIDNIKDRTIKGRSVQGEKIHTSKLTEEKVKSIRKLFNSGIKVTPLASKYKVDYKTMSNICKNISWKHIK